MTSRAAIARASRAGSVARLSSPTSSASARAAELIHRRGLAGGGDHHGSAKINFWQDPLSPSLWKEEQFVIISLSGWGLLGYGGYKLFSGGKKETKEKVVEASQ